MQEEDAPLPVLRSDIQLNEAPPEPEGAPTWTLYDPVANKYYKIGWLEFECLARFKDCRTVNELVKKVKSETTLDPEPEIVEAITRFLLQHNLVHAAGGGAPEHFETLRERMDRPLWERILHGYLFFTVPLFKPQRFLEKTYPFLKIFLTRHFMTIVFALLAYGLFLSIQRFDELFTTFMSYLSFEGALLFLGATVIVKIIHELGHAYVATKYGVPVTVIGVAFIVMYPILYTETTNAWKLQSRRDRLYIAAGGLMAELTLASVTILLWNFLSPGVGQSLCFMIGIVSLLASFAINLNPLMKFDGYYLFSDMVEVDNLQDRSFALAKWKLRRLLWGWNDPSPEILPREKQSMLITFGYAVWIYRFFLYLGIGLLVFHIFFQPLGLILMIVELGFFIGLPILREIKVWAGRFPDIAATWRGRAVIGFCLLGLIVAIFPVSRAVEIPAVMHDGNYMRFYTPISARVDEIAVTTGQAVEKGDLLFRLSSPQLDFNIGLVSQKLENLLEIRRNSQATLELARKRLTIDSEIEKTRKELGGYYKIQDQLEIRAPFSGLELPYSSRRDMRPGISVSAMVISLRPHLANDISLTL